MASLGDLYNDLKTLCKQWFYDKTESDGRFSSITHTHGNLGNDGKVGSASGKIITTGTDGAIQASDSITKSLISDFSHSHGNLTNDGKIGSTANLPVKTGTGGALITGSFGTTSGTFAEGNHNHSGTYAPVSHDQATSTITNSTAFDHIKSGESTTLTLDTQAKINDAINTKLGTLMEADIVVVTDNKGTASASTMNKLYLEAKSGGASGDGYNIWITVRTGTSPNYSYAWEKVDDFDLQTLSVAWANVTGKPSTFTPSSHTHGYITNGGAVTQMATDTYGVNAPLVQDHDNNDKVSVANIDNSFIFDSDAHSNIGSSANAAQNTINTKIDTALGNKITKSSSATGLLKDDGTVMTSGTASTNWAVGNHTHGNILSGGTITTDVAYKTNNSYGKLVITNTSNKVGTISAIDVWDEIVNQLIAYGSS